MTPEEPKPLPEEPEALSEGEDTEAPCDEEWPEGKEYPYTPMTREDFPPGQEYCRDLFFAFRDEMDERQAEWERQEALKQAAKAGKSEAVAAIQCE